eukprot:4677031-Pyramimonas_sp.AAC.1
MEKPSAVVTRFSSRLRLLSGWGLSRLDMISNGRASDSWKTGTNQEAQRIKCCFLFQQAYQTEKRPD